MCLIGNTVLLCMQLRGIKPHLLARGMSHGIFRVVAGIWGIFSNQTGEGHSNLHLDQQSQDSCLVMTDSSESKLGLAE